VHVIRYQTVRKARSRAVCIRIRVQTCEPYAQAAVQNYRLLIETGEKRCVFERLILHRGQKLAANEDRRHSGSPEMAGLGRRAAGIGHRQCSFATGSQRLPQKPAPRICPSRQFHAVASGPSAAAPSIERPILLNGQVRICRPTSTRVAISRV